MADGFENWEPDLGGDGPGGNPGLITSGGDPNPDETLNEDTSLDLSGAGTSLGMIGAGIIGDESESTTENAEEVQRQVDRSTTEPAETAAEMTDPASLSNWARNIGPDWMDEGVLVVLAILALLFLRPYVEAGNTAADAVTS